jgi:HNH endonuclease/NUMOD4 motif
MSNPATLPFLHRGEAERWLPVVGYEGVYAVSDLGRVRSLARVIIVATPSGGTFERPIRARVMKTHVDAQGYLAVRLSGRDSSGSPTTVHRLVAAAFIGPCPPGQEVRHLDGDRTNCVLVNLAYGTHSDNVHDSVQHGTHPWASRTKCPEGHKLLPHTEADGRTHRRCQECPPVWQQRWREKMKKAKES